MYGFFDPFYDENLTYLYISGKNVVLFPAHAFFSSQFSDCCEILFAVSSWMNMLLPLAFERGTCIITNMGASKNFQSCT